MTGLPWTDRRTIELTDPTVKALRAYRARRAKALLALGLVLNMLMLGDEPTGNLDSARAAEVLALLRRFNRERGQTVLLVTHDPEVGATCDRIIRMRDGLIVGDEHVGTVQVAA